MVYPALLTLMRTPRLPVVDWTDAPADLNGLVRFCERRNLVSARVPSGFKRSSTIYFNIHMNSEYWARAVFIRFSLFYNQTENLFLKNTRSCSFIQEEMCLLWSMKWNRIYFLAGSDHVTGFAPSTSYFPCQCQSTSASCSSSSVKKDKRTKTGNLQTNSRFLGYGGEMDRKTLSLYLFVLQASEYSLFGFDWWITWIRKRDSTKWTLQFICPANSCKWR